MFEKIKNLPLRQYLEGLKDIRALGLIAFGVIVLLVSYSGLGVIQTNYQLQQRLTQLQEQNKVSELENNNQKLRNEYLKSDAYLELTARKQFGRAAPGETLVLVPKTVALSHTVPALPKDQLPQNAVPISKPKYQQNFEAWMDFFLHRE